MTQSNSHEELREEVASAIRDCGRDAGSLELADAALNVILPSLSRPSGVVEAIEGAVAKLGVAETIMDGNGWLRNGAGYLTDAGLWLDRARTDLRLALSTQEGRGREEEGASRDHAPSTGSGDECRSAPSQHTPGPWQTRDDYTSDGRLTIIGNVDGEYVDGKPECTFETVAICQDEFGEALPNAEANARLIRTAPDLLEALKGVACWKDAITALAPELGGLLRAIYEAEAVIAKATGVARAHSSPPQVEGDKSREASPQDAGPTAEGGE